MARAVPPDLISALESPVRQPAVSLVVQDVFDRSYSSATGGASGRSAVVRLGSSSYVRAYVTQPALGSNATVSTQVLTDVTNAAQLAAWSVRSTSAAGPAGVCLALYGTTLFLFYQRLSDLAVCYQTSADGITWTAETVASSPAARVWALASTGNDDLIQAQDATPGNDAVQSVLLLTYSGGVFSTASTWTNSAGQVTGLSAIYQAGSYRMILGAQSRAGGGLALCSLSYASGVWSGLTTIHPNDDPAASLAIANPTLALIDGTYRVAASLVDSGVASGAAGQRCELWTSPDFVHWYLEQTAGTPFSYGCCLAAGPAGGWLLADAGTVLLSTAAAGATPAPLDISGSLIRIEIDEPASDVATAVVVLDNHDGRFSGSFPPSGSIRVGARATLMLGYDTNLVTTHTFWVDHIQAANAELPAGTNGHETATVTVRLSSRARRMNRPSPVERVYQGATTLYLISAVAVAAGIAAAPTSPGTAQFGETVDSFALSAPAPSSPGSGPGTMREGFERLRTLYGFDWFLDENEVLQLREPQAADPSTFTYGISGIQSIGHSLAAARRPNHVRVAAPAAGVTPHFADAVDFSAQAAAGEVVVKRVTERLLASSAQAQIRAGLELRRSQRDSLQGWARLPLNPMHQPLDVVSIADESLTATLRIERIRWLIDLDGGVFEQQVGLRAP